MIFKSFENFSNNDITLVEQEFDTVFMQIESPESKKGKYSEEHKQYFYVLKQSPLKDFIVGFGTIPQWNTYPKRFNVDTEIQFHENVFFCAPLLIWKNFITDKKFQSITDNGSQNNSFNFSRIFYDKSSNVIINYARSLQFFSNYVDLTDDDYYSTIINEIEDFYDFLSFNICKKRRDISFKELVKEAINKNIISIKEIKKFPEKIQHAVRGTTNSKKFNV